MSKIKKPKWDKQNCNPSTSGSYGPGTTILPNDRIDVGMTVRAKHKSDCVIIKITKVENNRDAEGTIMRIIPKIEGISRTDLSVGDNVFINLLDIENLSSGKKS